MAVSVVGKFPRWGLAALRTNGPSLPCSVKQGELRISEVGTYSRRSLEMFVDPLNECYQIRALGSCILTEPGFSRLSKQMLSFTALINLVPTFKVPTIQ